MDDKSRYLFRTFLIYLPILFVLAVIVHELLHYLVGEMLVGECSLSFPVLEDGNGLIQLEVVFKPGIEAWKVTAFRLAGGFGVALVSLFFARVSTSPSFKSASMFIFFYHFPYAFAETIEEGSVTASTPLFWLVLVSVGVFGGVYSYAKMQDVD